MWIIPSELLSIISRLFSSARDLLNFSLICKRYYSIALSKIKEKNYEQSREMLNLFVKKEIVVGSNEAEVHFILPNHQRHGQVLTWSVDPQFEGKFKALADRACLRPLDFGLVGFSINKPEKIRQAEVMIQEHGKLYLEYYCHFNKLEWLFKEYHYNEQTCSNQLANEGGYVDGQRHGIWKTYDWDDPSLLDHVTYYVHGKEEHGIRYSFDSEGLLSCTQVYRDGKAHGEVETYDTVQGVNDETYAVLTGRNYVFDAKLEGTAEEWDLETGVLTSLGHWRDDRQHGTLETWDPITAIKTSLFNWKNQRNDGECFTWNKHNGRLKRREVWDDGKLLTKQSYSENYDSDGE